MRADTSTAISLTATGTTYSQNFDSLVSSGTGTLANNTPAGWGFSETGGDANYTANNGDNFSGDTYSYGSNGNTERAFGQLNSNAVTPTIGARFTNNTGATLTSLDIAYTGEQWKADSGSSLSDVLDFDYSVDATSFTTGIWTPVNQLDFTTPQTTANGPLNGNTAANRTARSHSITGLNIPNGATFWIRWTSPNISGNDDGLAVDDFSLTPQSADNPPGVSSTVPADNAVNVAVNSNISITFNDPVTASANSFQINCNTSGAHPFALSGGSTTFTLDPTTDFAQTEVCTVIVFAAQITDQDGAPNNMAQDYVFDFTTFPTPTNPSAVGAANPNSLQAGNSTLLTVTVTPGTNPASTGIGVTADLTAINGSANQQFFDNGMNGDQTAGDNVFSYQALVPANVTSGAKTLPVNVSDTQARTATTSISVTITAPLGGQSLPFSQNWSNTNLITANNDWSAVPGMVGYLGDNPNTTQPGIDPQTILSDLSNTTVTVVANQTDPLAEMAMSGGVAEFELANPTIAIKGSGTADAAHILINLDTTNQSNITVFYNLRDLDASSNNAVQPVALQYRVGNSGNFTNVPAAFVADASTANAATLVTPVGVALPAAVNNQPLVQLRIITANAFGADEWIGIDDIAITPNGTLPLTATGSASPSEVNPGNQTLLTVRVNPGTNPTSTNVSVTADLTTIGGSASQQFFDNGTNGDATAGDNVYSFSATIPVNLQSGSRSLAISVADAQNRTASSTISLTINSLQQLLEHLALGNPSNATTDVNQPFNYLMLKPQYALSYHRDRGIPNWASWHLDSTWIGSASRQDDFRPDSTLPAGWYQVTDQDYSGSGFDRGHHVPSGDRTRSIPDNSATFLMTNMMPQAGGNNQGPWNNLEIYSRSLAGQGNELYIVMGGSGMGGVASGTTVTNTIAGGKVTVPAQTWKVILVLPVGDNDVSRVNTNTRTIAVIMPNNENIRHHAWEQYIVSVDQVEALTGYNFFSEVPASIQNVIEAKIDGSNCSFSINQTSANAPSAGNSGSVGVTAGTGCGWTATSNNSWITINGGATGSGNGTVNYTVAANTGAARTGTLTIGGQTFTVNQDAAAASRSISGTITYAVNQSKPVPGTMVNASGSSNVSVQTNLSGAYSLEGLFDGGNYTVTPTKTGNINGITAFDATLVLRCVAAGNSCALTPEQRTAADADGDTALTAFDATQILRFVAANGQNANTGQVGNWKFNPIFTPHPALNSNVSGENYTGFLIGDIDGDWAP
ncbi:MAG: DNA/RNA non-specific endonuclease [Acidobacteriota bacterium]|nr:DNA/RNA non-specific endonuclease [Acidobacteriota bacterium]